MERVEAQDKLWQLTLHSTLYANFHADEDGRNRANKDLEALHKSLLQAAGINDAKAVQKKPKRNRRRT